MAGIDPSDIAPPDVLHEGGNPRLIVGSCQYLESIRRESKSMDGSRIDTPAIEAAIRTAWETTSASLLTDAEIATLYS